MAADAQNKSKNARATPQKTGSSEKTASDPKQKVNAEQKELVKTLVIAVALAMVFRSLLFEPFHIPSGSMKETLLVGDYIFVSKYSYGYSRYSFPLGFGIFDGRVLSTLPERGDVIVFRQPPNPSVDFIKRLVGLPGDRIQVKEGVLYINGTAVPRVADGEFTEPGPFDSTSHIPVYTETLPNGVSYHVLDETPLGDYDNTPEFLVPEGHYFMMGDNRDNSNDSRTQDVGFVPVENLVGRAEIIWFSADGSAPFWKPLGWLKGLRQERFFQGVH